jgi:hypothetical protein
MKALVTMLVGTACIASLAGCAKEKTATAPPSPPPSAPSAANPTPVEGIKASDQAVLRATVVAINHKTRHVTLRGPEGNTVSFVVDPSVRNFKQIHKGDVVVVTYYESIAARVLKPGEGKVGITAADEIERAEPGQLPSGTAASTTTITAKITAIDKPHQTVTLMGPRGNSKTIKVLHPENLDKVKVGDLVQITYTESLAIAVEKASK